MVHCVPASQFCCGCALGFGVKSMLWLHLFVNVAINIFIGFAVIYNNQTQTILGNGFEMVLQAGFALAGIPVIAAALWGCAKKIDTPLRMYMLYASILVVVDVVIIFHSLFGGGGSCSNFGQVLNPSASAFSCGLARIVSCFIFASAVGFQMYVIFCAWSYCEDLADGGPDFTDLMNVRKSRSDLSPHDSLEELATHVPRFVDKVIGAHGYKDIGDYGAIVGGASYGLGGGTRLFNQTAHEMQYPPPRKV
jgi:hypothetical protein